MKVSGVLILLGCGVVTLVSAWTKEDHEIFRLRDEVELAEGAGVTFYDLLGVPASASLEEINKQYYKKSRRLHPDKVKQGYIAAQSTGQAKAKATKPQQGKEKTKKKPGVHVSKGPSQAEVSRVVKEATERYARLAGVVEILRGPERERYDHFVKNGFPKWRGTGYYYARFRPGLGSVLLGLFLVGGGGAHYTALYLGWKRQREFVDRYIRHARRAAWGDELGIRGIPATDGTSVPPSVPVDSNDGAMQPMNRRERRLQEKESKKGKASNASSSLAAPTRTAVSASSGARKKVVAENGKVLIVDAEGHVYLEEEDEDGETQEYLLNIDEIPKPTIQQTILFRLPIWLFDQTAGRLIKVFRQGTSKTTTATADAEGTSSSPSSSSSSDSDSDEIRVEASIESAPNGKKPRWRGKKMGRSTR